MVRSQPPFHGYGFVPKGIIFKSRKKGHKNCCSKNSFLKLPTALCCCTILMLSHPWATERHRTMFTIIAKWHWVLQPDQVRLGVKRDGTTSCHLGWKVPLHQHVWPRLHVLCCSCSYRALREHSKDLLDLSFLLWWWLKRKNTPKPKHNRNTIKQKNKC